MRIAAVLFERYEGKRYLRGWVGWAMIAIGLAGLVYSAI